MDKIFVLNFKMYQTKRDVLSYLENIKDKIPIQNVIFCPTSLYASTFLEEGYQVGIQNISDKEFGSYTGEIAAKQASSVGIDYVLLGHSERKQYQKETEGETKEKIKCALKAHLKIILCIGETEIEKKEGNALDIVQKRLQFLLSSFTKEDMQNITVAYEPVWAIGTGSAPSSEDLISMIIAIQNVVKEMHGYEKISVLYGGSVDVAVCQRFASISALNGFLVGTSSLHTEVLLQMIKVAVTL